MFLKWMSGLLVVAGVGPTRWDSTSTDLFISSSVLFMPFCLHSYFTCIVLQRQSFSQLSFSGFFFNYILPWVSHVHTVHRVYISCNVLFTFYWFRFHRFHCYSAYPLYSCTSMYIPIPRSVIHLMEISLTWLYVTFINFLYHFLFTLYFMCFTYTV